MSKKITKEEFIKRGRKIHEDKYNYSKVEYINSQTKVCIICPIHGEFWQRPHDHLRGKGCKLCGNKKISEKLKSTKKSFIERAKQIHGDKYDYSKVNYINDHIKVCIICPIHGNFWQLPLNHLRGHGCKKCAYNITQEKLSINKEEFIKRAREIHGNKYDYSKVEYKGCDVKVCIICPEHGEFWQTPYKHVNCSHGCPKCNASRLEEEIRILLEEKYVEFVFQKKFDWLGKQSLDFYLPQYNVAIECQGEQHFMAVEHFGGVEYFQITKQRDQRKKQLCEEHGIRLLYYSNLHIDYPYKVFEDKEELLKEIIKLNE